MDPRFVSRIISRLGSRRVVYWGTRGRDAEGLLGLSNFEELFSLVAPLRSVAVKETCLESLTGERVDLDQYSTDLDKRDVIHDIRRGLLHAFASPAVVMPYRSCAVLSSAWFPRSDRVLHAGLFHNRQTLFEHKAWVESNLRSNGVQTLPWTYYADEELPILHEWSHEGSVVLRANRTDGGTGLSLIRPSSDDEWSIPLHDDGFLAAAPFLSPNVPLNVNACIFAGGQVVLHAASVQLIGLSMCTNRRFGYCGNDFAAIGEALTPSQLSQLEAMTKAVGRWLAEQGYLGAFGIDALVHDGKLYLVELNPRFQGSSLMSSRIDETLDRPSMFLNHLAAYLGIEPTDSWSLSELVKHQPPLSHILIHNTDRSPKTAAALSERALGMECRLVPAPDIQIQHEAIMFECVYPHQITADGASLVPEIEQQVTRAIAVFCDHPQGRLRVRDSQDETGAADARSAPRL